VFSRAEAVAASVVSFMAAAILAAYAFDAIGLMLHPFAILAIAALAAGTIAARMRTTTGNWCAFGATVAGTLAWLIWLAWPHLLPLGRGTDLTHHLLLVDYIDRTGRLVHDRTLAPYLGEMIDYTPGAHLLAVLAGRWTGRDGLHALYPVVALSVALKTGFVFLIALRCLPDAPPRTSLPLATLAVVLLFLPRAYFLGSFVHDSYLAQVVGELFAVAMWWAVACWDQRESAGLAAFAAVVGCGAFLTWPIWTAPPLLTLLTLSALHRDRSMPSRRGHVAIAAVPITVLAAVYAIGRVGTATVMAGTSGAVLQLSLANLNGIFVTVGAIGTVMAARDARARSAPVLLAAIVLQTAALRFVARTASAPYLALKMVYLAIYPLAVAGSYAMAVALRSAEAARSSLSRNATPSQDGARGFSRAAAAAWIVVAVLFVIVARGLATMPRPTPVISDPLLAAGRWAREHVSPHCIDYLVGNDDTAYWLHLAVLGNPRTAPRSLATGTFEPQKAVERWILPGGLPYAIAADVDTLPRDIRTNVDILARFGQTAVVKRRDGAECR
jgi:hypothetical protein